MKNPFLSVLKAQRFSRRGGPLSAALALQQMLLPASKPKRKRAAAKPRPVGGARSPGAGAPGRPARPAPGTFIAGRYQSDHGTIAYKLYTPSGSAHRRMPLVVMLHGCTQSAADFAAGTGMNALADELGFLVLYPEQSASKNLNRCWNWHQPRNQKRGGGEPAAIAALTLHAIAACRANPRRVYIAGISAGGTTAAITGAAYPEIYAAVGVHSGVASGNVSTLSGALSAMRNGGIGSPTAKTARPRPTIIFHGDRDKVVHPDNARGFRGVVAPSKAGPLVGQVRQGTSAGGREFTRTLYRTSAGEVLFEDWTLHGGGHAWSGGKPAGSYTDPAGPDASREMIRFFLARRRAIGRGG
ncbi:extracellular catalytic domain type 1 short-chain-length polyhydroxyalkanoate depolymerase [Rhizorhabdus argentea]|uniref:extracellular catalytic domain type 1 short-chain-length polyhydroxyalkanoate depolymerase n=1 Tax=Rhizorhabdus argentea TaxID=1387174 RepID=UPI0030EF254C